MKRGVFLKRLLQKLKQDPVLTISAVLAIVSCLVIHPDSAYLGYFNMDTLIMLFCLMLLVVVVLAVGILDRSVFKRIDYALLGTFCCFFVFIGNMNRMEALREILVQVLAGRECAVAVVLSQIISNVPAAILLSGYTSNIRGLIVGTNLGGLGTLIASMASLISYKQIAVWNPQLRKTYLIVFTGWNVAMLAVLLVGAHLFG